MCLRLIPFTTSGHHRYLPDVSLTAAGHDGYIIEQEGGLYVVGGTSASSPSFAGIMAIVDQHTGTRNGNPNSRFYPLAAQAPAVFHDVTTGTNAVPCAGGSSGCSTKSGVGHMNGYSAGAGYDLATGLGSVDANNLATYWSNVTPPPTIVSLSPNPMTASSSNQTLTITGSGFQSGLKVSLSCTGATVGNLTSVEQHADSGARQRRDHRPHLHRAGGQLQRPGLQHGIASGGCSGAAAAGNRFRDPEPR